MPYWQKEYRSSPNHFNFNAMPMPAIREIEHPVLWFILPEIGCWSKEFKLEKVVEESVKIERKSTTTKVFVREVAIRLARSNQVYQLGYWVLKWKKLLGLSLELMEEEVFFDVYRIWEVIALRKQGSNEPLFFLKTSFTKTQKFVGSPRPTGFGK